MLWLGSLWLRALASLLVDGSIAMLCGVVLARLWLQRNQPIRPLLFSITLCIGSALQLLSLAAVFTGEPSLTAVLQSLPDIVATHAGTVLALNLVAAVVLLIAGALGQPLFTAAALALAIVLRAGVGHAATQQLLSWSQALQAVHVGSMAVWSGGVIVSGVAVLPQLRTAPAALVGYLARLSRASTWAVVMVIVSGGTRAYPVIQPDLHAALHSAWGAVLAAKLLCVAAALALGYSNRRWLARNDCSEAACTRVVRSLRVEAIAMLLILTLSGVLANLAPPGN